MTEITDADKKAYKTILRTWLGRQLKDSVDLGFVKSCKKGKFENIPWNLKTIETLTSFIEQEGIVQGIFRISAENTQGTEKKNEWVVIFFFSQKKFVRYGQPSHIKNSININEWEMYMWLQRH